MNLRKKKELAAKVLRVGKHRIKFNEENLTEIKEAITKQDIITLHQEGLIKIKDKKGRKKIVKRKIRRGPGKIKFKIKKRKENYVKITRKLRRIIKSLRYKEEISRELYKELRQKIKMKFFKSKANLKEYLENLKKLGTEDKETRKRITKKGRVTKKSKDAKKK